MLPLLFLCISLFNFNYPLRFPLLCFLFNIYSLFRFAFFSFPLSMLFITCCFTVWSIWPMLQPCVLFNYNKIKGTVIEEVAMNRVPVTICPTSSLHFTYERSFRNFGPVEYFIFAEYLILLSILFWLTLVTVEYFRMNILYQFISAKFFVKLQVFLGWIFSCD